MATKTCETCFREYDVWLHADCPHCSRELSAEELAEDKAEFREMQSLAILSLAYLLGPLLVLLILSFFGNY